jgi:hypothetical protein
MDGELPAYKEVHEADLPYAHVAHDLGLSPLPVVASHQRVEDNQAVPYLFKEQPVRVMTGQDGEPWFVAKDVCDLLGDSNHRRSVSRLDDDEKGVTYVSTPGR